MAGLLVAADDDRKASQLGVLCLLDACVEGIHVAVDDDTARIDRTAEGDVRRAGACMLFFHRSSSHPVWNICS